MVPFLSVVIPAYNEAANIKDGRLDPAFAFLSKQKYPWELIFVNDGSTDATQELLTRLTRSKKNMRVLSIVHGGKAAAVRKGILAAVGEHILFTDLDQSTPLPEVNKFLTAHKDGADVVIGVRSETKNDTLFRRFRGWVFLTLVQLVAIWGIQDSQCGFKSFKKAAAKKVFTNLHTCVGGKITGGYMGAFDVEALFLAKKFGFRIDQVPVEWEKIASEKLDSIREPIKMFFDTFRIRFFDLSGGYEPK